MKYKFSDKEIKEILSKLVIIVDTREQVCDHILQWFTEKKIAFKREKLDYGDYSCMIPAGTFEGQKRDVYFSNDIAIERKFSIDELASNLKDNKTSVNEVNKEIIELLGEKYLQKVLKTDYNRLKYEFANMNRNKVSFFIFMEDKHFDENIRSGNFRAKYEPKTLYARIKSLEREFDTMIRPLSRDVIGGEIYNTLKYGVRDILKNRGFIEECQD